jgi:dihydroorotate dehydrogenase (fumarate)
MRSSVFYSYEQASPFTPERYAEEIVRAKEACTIPIIASIAGVSDDWWAKTAPLMQQAGADALELNTSCPHGACVLSEMDLANEMARLTRMVKGVVTLPVIPKMTGQLGSPHAAAVGLQEAGADGLVMFNRFTGLEVDLEEERPIMHGAYAGHGGPWVLPFVLRWISETSQDLTIPIAASGGITSGDDVAKVLLVGATIAEVCTAIYVEGFEVIARMRDALTRFMERKGYERLEDFRGNIAGHILTAQQVNRERTVRARIDPALCNRCRTCYRVCLYGAVDREENAYAINERCSGCGLCEQLCPQHAIQMVTAGPRPAF